MQSSLWLLLQLCISLSAVSFVSAFAPPRLRLLSATRNRYFCNPQLSRQPASWITLKAVTNTDGGDSSSKRRKRKLVATEEDSSNMNDSSAATSSSPPLTLRNDDAPVELAVRNIKQVIGTKQPVGMDMDAKSDRPFPTPITANTSTSSATTTTSTSNRNSNSALDDSLQQLLEDAKQMQSASSSSTTTSNSNNPLKQVLSTIVTIDFFVVCGFLLWFLLGIASSYIAKDDTIQIAFNSNFQAFVQPALGILMIGSIAGSVLGGDEDEENQDK